MEVIRNPKCPWLHYPMQLLHMLGLWRHFYGDFPYRESTFILPRGWRLTSGL